MKKQLAGGGGVIYDEGMEGIEWTSVYIASQIITVMYYGLLAYSYLLKSQRTIIAVGIASIILNAVAFVLLEAWTGLAMCGVALVRSVVRYVSDGKKSSFGTSKMFLVLVLLAIVAVTIPTYDGFLSLMSVFATAIYSYSVWQKRPVIYKLCGIPVGILWVVYCVWIGSIFGVILEAGLLLFAAYGFVKDWRMGKLNEGH